MKTEIGSHGAKTKLPELLRQVKTRKSFMIANRTGVQWVYVPYKGGAQAIADVAGGQSNVMQSG